MTIKFYVDESGNYLGGFDGAIPENGVEVATAPNDSRQIWNGTSWDALNIPEYKIYALMLSNSRDRSILPVDIDFKTGLAVDLYKDVLMSAGAPVSKTYYTDASISEQGVITYSNPIVKIEYTFDRDSIGLARSCTQKFKWYDIDGVLSTEYKEVTELLNTVEKIAEAEQRRGNIIADLKVKAIGLLMYTQQISQVDATALGRPFLAAYKQDIYNYIDEANTGFAASVTGASAETYPWLDDMTPYSVTIRQFILNAIA